MKNIDKRIIEEGFHAGYEVDYVTIQKADYECLKRLAERVQEMEDKLARIRFVNSDYDKINKRYREAIEDIKNAWKVTDTYQEYMDTIHDIINDLEDEE